MSVIDPVSILTGARTKFEEIVENSGLLDTRVCVSVRPLTAEEAIGQPDRRDFPIIVGKERVIEAEIAGARGHAYTDTPGDFNGRLRDVLVLPLASNQNRAVFIAVLNAVLRSLGLIEKSLHCQDNDPERCGQEIARDIRERWGSVTIGLIGLNPAIAEALVSSFGVHQVHITDLNPSNIQTVKFGVTIWDGKTETEELVRRSRVVLVTGTTLVNGTIDDIWRWIQVYGQDHLLYGVTAAGVCKLMELDNICPFGRGE